MNENEKYNIIKKLVDTDGNKQTAALKIGCTRRHINRLIAGYKKFGKSFFVHGNHTNKPATTIAADTKQVVLNLYQTKYHECNLTHFQELLAEMEDINISVSTISSILRKEYIISPKAHRSTKKKVKKELKVLKSKAKTKKAQAVLQSSLLELEEAHPRRSRCAYFGEMLKKIHLHSLVMHANSLVSTFALLAFHNQKGGLKE